MAETNLFVSFIPICHPNFKTNVNIYYIIIINWIICPGLLISLYVWTIMKHPVFWCHTQTNCMHGLGHIINTNFNVFVCVFVYCIFQGKISKDLSFSFSLVFLRERERVSEIWEKLKEFSLLFWECICILSQIVHEYDDLLVSLFSHW